MKKILFLLVLGLFLSTSSFALAHAGEDHSADTSIASDQIAEISIEEDLPPAGLTPDSPFYFLDTAFDNFVTFFTFGDEARSLRYLDVANERLSEIRVMLSAGNTKALENATRRYNNLMEQMELRAERVVSSQELEEKIAFATGSHQIVLERLLARAPEAAQEGLQNALERSGVNHRRHLENLIELDEDSAGQLSAVIIKRRFQALRDVAQDTNTEAAVRLEALVQDHDTYEKYVKGLEERNAKFKEGLADKLSDVYKVIYDIEELELDHLPVALRTKLEDRSKVFIRENKERLEAITETNLERSAEIHSKVLRSLTDELEHRPAASNILRERILSDLKDFDDVGRDISDKAQLQESGEIRQRVLRRVDESTFRHIEVLQEVREQVDENARDIFNSVIEKSELNREVLLKRLESVSGFEPASSTEQVK